MLHCIVLNMVNKCCIPGSISNYKSMKINVQCTSITVSNDALRK